MPSTLGSTTEHRFDIDPEAHKLHIEFDVETAQVVHDADPVILAANGKIQLAGSAAPAYTVIGVSIHEAVAAERATVSMKAYCVVKAEAAAASLNAGPIQLGAWNATTGRREYATTADAALAIGHNLTQATADGEAILAALLL